MINSAYAQILFQEDFDGIGGPTAGGAGTYTFPAGWLLRNVDNGTPNAAVSYVNEAWERREDFNFNVADSCAFSTSWTTPTGTANDWMWTPPIAIPSANCQLEWNAVTYDVSYPDGYEVRVMVAPTTPTGGPGVIGNQITNSTVLFTTVAENTTWTARTASLSAYAGQTIRIAYRNNSNDKFLLLIDDVTVRQLNPIDAQLTFADTISQYTLMPIPQASPLNFNGTVRNNGTSALANVSVRVNVFDGVTNVHTANSTAVPSLAVSASSNWTIAGYTPTDTGFYTVQFIAQQTSGTDLNTSNDTLYQYLLVTDSTYARDNGIVTGGLGIGAGNGGYMGQSFDVVVNDLLTTIGVYVTAGYTGRPLGLAVWSTTSGGVPNAIVAVTDTILYPDDSARYYEIPMFGGPFNISTGEYVVTAIEFVADSTMQIGTCVDKFTATEGWVFWPTIPGNVWTNLEDFGSPFARAFVIRPNFGDLCLNNSSTITSTQATCISCADGSATVTPSGTDGVVTYSWSPSGGNAATATGLLTGVYVVTITDGFGCVIMDTVSVNYDVCGLFSATANPTSSTCQTCPDGSAQVIVTGNNSTVTYAWSNGGTSDTIQNVLTGTYTVIVSDSSGCSDTISVFVGYGICGSFATTTSSVNASCGSCADGSASVVTVGNNGPLTYLWSNGDTTSTINNVLPGTYYVTVTDTAGCTSLDSVVVQFGTAIATIENASLASLYPNPSNGTFQVDLNFDKPTDATITVVNMLGEIIATQKVAGAIKSRVEMKVNTAAGMYSVRVATNEEEIVLPLNIVK